VVAVCPRPEGWRDGKAPGGSPLVRGKSVTGFANTEEAAVGLTDAVPFLVEDMLKQNGGDYSKAGDWQPYAITDGNLVTGQNPASSESTAKAFLAELVGAQAASGSR
jgi:putative intracellular protease/amidase